MPVEVRPATPAEMEEYRRVALSALVLSPRNVSPEAIQGVRPEMTLCAFVDGRLATAYAAWPLKMRINGGAVPTAGITYVGTLPYHRGQGLLREIIVRHFELMYARGEQPLAALLASQAAIYHRFGYAVVSTRHTYQVEPRFIRFVHPAEESAPPGTLTETGDADVLNRLYRSFCLQRSGYLHRGHAAWMNGVLRPAPSGAVLFRIVYEENGEPLGYLVYTVEPRKVPDGRPWQQVFIRDLVWLSARAYAALWGHLATFGLASDIIWMRVPPDDPLPHLVLEPRCLNIGSADGLLARIVDVARALPLRDYGGEGAITFELMDGLCPWNAGRFRLETSSGGTDVRRTSQAAQMRLPVDTLAMLLFGQISPSEASAMGRMDVLEADAVPIWDRLMRTKYKPFCPDFF
ncbi:MAG: GNAT family N-acetyltransferase [Desulfobacteraceae bacterium]|nr:MAG: GNAT family N-acetyltransferase [Desulfobacteraceae bacterium]